MVLNLRQPDDHELRARITVFGVGGAGCNAVNNMIEKKLEGVEFIVANTDAQALAHSKASRRIQLGAGVTRGLGAGSKPEVGLSAAEESIEEIMNNLDGCHMCFITAGMGGGTGTGAAPVVARAAREMGILTVGVVTKPFHFEGARRMEIAEEGVAQLQQVVDTLIVIPNQNLFQVASERTTFMEAFMMADDVLYQGVQGVTDLMVRPGMINLDFADVRSVMEEMGKAMMGTGEAEGETRAIDAAEKAIANPLLDEVSLKGARGVLINITGGYDLTLFEVDEAANRIKDEVDPNALIKFGSAIDPEMEGRMRVSVVATGIEAEGVVRPEPREETAARRVRTTDPALVSAARTRPRQPAAVTSRSGPVRPAVTPRPAPEPRAASSEPADAASPETATAEEPAARAPEPAAGTAPTPDEIRARAEAVRRRAAEARAAQAAPRAPVPEEVAESPDLFTAAPIGEVRARREPPLFGNAAGRDEGDEELRTRAASAPGRSTVGSGLHAINALINRMTGGQRRDQAVGRDLDAVTDPADDEEEIPAFLRRQAN